MVKQLPMLFNFSVTEMSFRHKNNNDYTRKTDQYSHNNVTITSDTEYILFKNSDFQAFAFGPSYGKYLTNQLIN